MLTELNTVDTYYQQQRATAVKTSQEVTSAWRARDRDIPFWDSWNLALPLLTDALTEGQFEAATRAAEYVPAVMQVQGATATAEIKPSGYLSPTSFLEYGLGAAPARGMQLMLENDLSLSLTDAFIAQALQRFTMTMVEDAGREAVAGGMLMEPAVKFYYRKLQLPACNRCAILVGRPYRKAEHFKRHERCDCQTVPAIERDRDAEFDIVTEIKNGNVTGFNKAEVDAIVNQGADVNQITNAKRNKLKTANIYGQNVRTTTEGTTKRAVAGKRLQAKYGAEKVPGNRYMVSRTPRLTVHEIYRQANNQAELDKMMKRFGYVF